MTGAASTSSAAMTAPEGHDQPTSLDDAVHAAAGTRTAARWLASALGAVPSLAVLSAVVRAPGTSGFDPVRLAFGVGLAALGALVGVLAFAHVLAPVRLEDDVVRTRVSLSRIPNQRYVDWNELSQHLADSRQLVGGAEVAAKQAKATASFSKAEADEYEAKAVAAKRKSEEAPNDDEIKRMAASARELADAKALQAAIDAGKAAAADVEHTFQAEQAARRRTIKDDAYRLAASDDVGRRFAQAQRATVAAVVLVAVGVILLGLAPRTTQPTSSVQLVRLQLNSMGQQALACAATAVDALRTGGTDGAPQVIILPGQGCPARSLTFTVTGAPSLGTIVSPAPTPALSGTQTRTPSVSTSATSPSPTHR
jgi:hypothetical protein